MLYKHCFRQNYLSLLLLVFSLFYSCSPSSASLTSGQWRGVIEVNGQAMPFNFEVSEKDGKQVVHLINGDERILINEISFTGDSVRLEMHIFDAFLVARVQENNLKGRWVRQDQAHPHSLPFSAELGKTHRFSENPAPAATDVSGKWEVHFKGNDGKTYPAIGEFKQQGNALTGTFLTTTGDYRYLQGEVNGPELSLSAFDGAHAFLFNARLQPDSTLAGDFHSGQSGHKRWTASRNPAFRLASADSLTFLKPGHERLAFTFPNLQGQPVSISDPKFQNKVVVVQIFGSWCPNCMDETKFLTSWYSQNKNRGVEIIGLGYEVSPEFDKAKARIEKMRDRLNVPFTLLVAGTKDKEKVAESLPALNRVLSFPTTLYLDKKGKVRKIHTGFSGPGTGKYYEEFVQDFNRTVDGLLAEQ